MIIRVDLAKEDFTVRKLKQNTNNILEFEVYANGMPFLLYNKTVQIHCLNKNGNVLIQTDKITKSENKLTVDLIKDATAIADDLKLQVYLEEDGKDTKSFILNFIVKPSVVKMGNIIPSIATDIIDSLTNKITQAIGVKNDTEELIRNGGAAKKGDLYQINVLDYGIKGNGTLEDVTQLNNLFATTQENKTIIFPENKIYRINRSIILNAKNCTFDIGGTVICENCDGIVVNNVHRSKIKINTIKKELNYNPYSDWWTGGKTIPYLTFTNSAIALNSASHNEIKIGHIYGFNKALSFEPTGYNNIPNGCQYNDFLIGQLECNTYGLHFERKYNGSWINSNHFTSGKFSGYTYIVMKTTSIIGDKYNQNVFDKFGCEYVYNGAIDIQEGEENSFNDFRFDQVDGTFIKTSDVTFSNKFKSTYRTNVQNCIINGKNNIIDTPSYKNGSIYALKSTNVNTKIVNTANVLDDNTAMYTEGYSYKTDLPMTSYYKVFQDSKGALRTIGNIPNISKIVDSTEYEINFNNLQDIFVLQASNIVFKINLTGHMSNKANRFIFITRDIIPTVTFKDYNSNVITDLNNKFLKPNTVYLMTRIDTYEVFEIGKKVGVPIAEANLNINFDTSIIDATNYDFITIEQPNLNSITDINGKVNGKVIDIMTFNSNTTLVHNSNKIRLKGNVDAKIMGGNTIRLRCFNGIWWEVFRSF